MPDPDSRPAAPLKLAIVRQRYTPFGGAERFVERALAALEKGGEVETTLICRSWRGTVEDSHRRILVCNPRHLGRRWRDAGFAAAARRHFADFDLVQSHERIAGCHLFRAGDGVHAAWLERLGAARGGLARRLLAVSPYHRHVLAAERAMFADPALRAVICNSRLVAGEIRRHYGVAEQKLEIIHNGVDLERFHPGLAAIHRRPLRDELGIGADAPLLLFVGSGFERKGVDTLLAALARTPRRDARLLVVGADRRLPRMRRLADGLGLGDRVRFVGAVTDVRPYYGAADAFVLPTLYDPFPNAALEALACGLPVLTTSGCGVAEFIAEGGNGFVVEPGDVARLAARLADLVALAGAAAAHDAARAAVIELSLEALAGRLTALYRRLAAAGAPV